MTEDDQPPAILATTRRGAPPALGRSLLERHSDRALQRAGRNGSVICEVSAWVGIVDADGVG